MATITKGGKVKSTFFVYSVGLSFLFIAVHVMLLSFLLEPIHVYFTGPARSLSGGWLNFYENVIPALLSAAICNLPFIRIRDKRLIIAAYVMIFIYVAIVFIAAALTFEGEAKIAFMVFLRTVIPAPIICGFLVSGGVYAVYNYRKNKVQ